MQSARGNQAVPRTLGARGEAREEVRGGDVPPVVREVLRADGHPLDARARAFMESRFGRDFGQVRTHTGDKAAASARAVGALAYTVGRQVVFGLSQRNASMGGSVPAVDLDPGMPGYDVSAAYVFPADDATDALFRNAPATYDNLHHIRYLNFGRGRWVRPGNISVLRRLR